MSLTQKINSTQNIIPLFCGIIQHNCWNSANLCILPVPVPVPSPVYLFLFLYASNCSCFSVVPVQPSGHSPLFLSIYMFLFCPVMFNCLSLSHVLACLYILPHTLPENLLQLPPVDMQANPILLPLLLPS